MNRFELFPVEDGDDPLPGVWIRYGETLGRLKVEPNRGPVDRLDLVIFDPLSGAAGRSFPFWIFSGLVPELPRARGRKVSGLVLVESGTVEGRPLDRRRMARLCDELPSVDEAAAEAGDHDGHTVNVGAPDNVEALEEEGS